MCFFIKGDDNTRQYPNGGTGRRQLDVQNVGRQLLPVPLILKIGAERCFYYLIWLETNYFLYYLIWLESNYLSVYWSIYKEILLQNIIYIFFFLLKKHPMLSPIYSFVQKDRHQKISVGNLFIYLFEKRIWDISYLRRVFFSLWLLLFFF